MDTAIKNIIFDVGDVLVHFRYRDHMRDLGFSEEAVDFLSENMVLTEYWNELDLGMHMNRDAVEHFTSRYPQYENEIRCFWDNTDGLVAEYTYAAPLIKGLKSRGYKVYALSNYPLELSAIHWPKFLFLPETDGHIISAEEKLAKPDPRFYQLLFTRYGLKPEECIFIDDREKNILAAEVLGMKAILFTGLEELIIKLTELEIIKPEGPLNL